MKDTKILFAEASDGEITKVVDNAANNKKSTKYTLKFSFLYTQTTVSNSSLIISEKCMVTPNFLFGYQEYLLRSTFSG